MKKSILYALLIIQSVCAIGQNRNNYNEEIIFSTDRNFYVVGENICFSASVLNPVMLESKILSKILYIELIDPNGKQILGNKYWLDEATLSTNIAIPEELVSGNYYLRAYTKFMRNYGPQAYAYQYIKIINPYNDELLKSNINDSIKKVDLSEDFTLKLNKESYKNKELVKVNIEIPSYLENLIEYYQVTVSLDQTFYKNIALSKTKQTKQSTNYIPESRGLTITGKVTNDETKNVIPFRKINLTIIDNPGNIFLSTLSDSLGNFIFNLPKENSDKDLFISAESKINEPIKLLIDNDFCTESVELPNPKYILSEDEKDIALKIITNNELQKYYSDTTHNTSDTLINSYVSKFYGEPTASLIIDDYIKLPTLEDYFVELPFNAKIKKEKGEKRFKILGTHPELSIYDPLIMIDMIPIYNIENILKIDPNKVEKIDVVTEPYALGDMIYGGLLNIVTKRNDFAGIDLPQSGIFINYKYLTVKNEISLLKNETPLPDIRTTLYWDNNLDSSVKEFEFNTGNTPGVFLIYVKAITKNGKEFYSTIKFSVN